jgi:hypothetical protein
VVEALLRTGPINADTDGGRISDSDEGIIAGTDANDPNDPVVVDVPSFASVAFWVLIALRL